MWKGVRKSDIVYVLIEFGIKASEDEKVIALKDRLVYSEAYVDDPEFVKEFLATTVEERKRRELIQYNKSKRNSSPNISDWHGDKIVKAAPCLLSTRAIKLPRESKNGCFKSGERLTVRGDDSVEVVDYIARSEEIDLGDTNFEVLKCEIRVSKPDEAKEEKKRDEPKIEDVREEEDKEKMDKKGKKVIEEKYTDDETLNRTKPIWMGVPDVISYEEYDGFYKQLTVDWHDHIAVKHSSLEGQLGFRTLCFVPERLPFDLFEDGKKMFNVKLYDASRMKDNKKKIYGITGEMSDQVKSSSVVERVRKRGHEAIYMIETNHEYCLIGYDGKTLVPETKGIALPEDEEKKKKCEEYVKVEKLSMLDNDILVKKFEKIKTSDGLVTSSKCAVTSQYGWSSNTKTQVMRDLGSMGNMAVKKHLVVNPDILNDYLRQKAELDKHEKYVKDWMFMFETYLLY